MGMMFGFAAHRRAQLEAELRRMAEELPRLGVERAYLAGDLADGRVGFESGLELVIVHETNEAYRRPFQHIGILSLEFHVDKLSRPLL